PAEPGSTGGGFYGAEDGGGDGAQATRASSRAIVLPYLPIGKYCTPFSEQVKEPGGGRAADGLVYAGRRGDRAAPGEYIPGHAVSLHALVCPLQRDLYLEGGRSRTMWEV